MTFRTSTRRRFPAALLLTALLLSVPVVSASADPHPSQYPQVPRSICRIDWQEGPWHVKRLIRCANIAGAFPEGPPKALAIADRESGFRPKAYNSYSGASGIYQHLRRYWPGRPSAFGFSGWSAFNARANIIVTIRMVHRVGSWAPWGG